MPDNTLWVGRNERGEVVINHPQLITDSAGYIVFSPAQARSLADLLAKHADEAEGRMLQSELDTMAHHLAWENAITCIECNCLQIDLDGVADRLGGWLDLAASDAYDDDLAEQVRYLEARGLIERHEDNPNWISLRNEEEATR